MSVKKQLEPKQPTEVYIVHLASGTVSVEATSLAEAIQLAEQLGKQNKESSNG